MNSAILPKNSPIRFLALGDSYTIGESVAEDQRWPVQLQTALVKRGYRVDDLEIEATTGWRTDQLLQGILDRRVAKDWDLVSLLIGVNNQYQGKPVSEYEKEFVTLLDLAIDFAGGDGRRVFVLSIPDYGYTPFGRERQDEISVAIDRFNEVNKRIAIGKGVSYIDITDISRRGLNDPELVADDGLHPSGKMYALWTERILKGLNLTGEGK